MAFKFEPIQNTPWYSTDEIEYREKAMNMINKHRWYDGHTDIQEEKKLFSEVMQDATNPNNIDDLEYGKHIEEANRMGTTSSKRYFVNHKNNKIFVQESLHIRGLIDQIIFLSYKEPQVFGKGTDIILQTLFEHNRYWFNRSYQDFKGLLYKQFFLIIHEEKYLFLQLFRNEIDEVFKKEKIKEFQGGILHVLQHFQQYNKTPMSAISKEGFIFNYDYFFELIINGFFFEMKDNKKFKIDFGENKELHYEFYQNSNSKAYFLNHLSLQTKKNI
jgi:hypothetical protein